MSRERKPPSRFPELKRTLRSLRMLGTKGDDNATARRLGLASEDALPLARFAAAQLPKNPSLAADAARLAVVCDPTCFEAWATSGASLASTGRERDAVMAYVKAAALRPDDIAVHVSLGELFISLMELEAAAAELELAIALDPGASTPAGVRAQMLVARTLMKFG